MKIKKRKLFIVVFIYIDINKVVVVVVVVVEEQQKMGQKRQKMIYIDGELIDWYTKKYPEGNFSGMMNELLKNYLYIQIDENVENLEGELKKIENKRLEYEQKALLLKSKIEEVEQKAIKEQEILQKKAQQIEENKTKCVMCGEQTSDKNKMELNKGKLMHRTCFNSADAKTINNLLIKIKDGEI